MEEKDYTLIFVRNVAERRILLGMKKRGFGVNKYNGFGGKVEKGESIEEGAIRELQEESGLVVSNLSRVGYLVFNMKESQKIMKVHVYCCNESDCSEELIESDEMKPEWFNYDDIPYSKMWPDDPYWMPLLLENEQFIGRFDYDDDDTITDYTLKNMNIMKEQLP